MKLPKKPSELLYTALHDLELVERDPKYRVNMGVYHSPSGDKCEVCFAGALLAKTCRTPIDHDMPFGFQITDMELRKKCYAIDMFRTGNIEIALQSLGIKNNDLPGRVDVVYYRLDAENFKEDILAIADMLTMVGL